MRIIVDLNRCQSYGQCCFAAPTVFRFHNGEALEFDPAPGDDLRQQVLLAVASCPVQAISIGIEDEQYEALHADVQHKVLVAGGIQHGD